MIVDNKIQVGSSDAPVCLDPSMACRHGLIAGATGTGKTTTLKVLAEGFSDLGVPVFLADAKGDVSSLAMPGKMNEKLASRLESCGIDSQSFSFAEYPVRFWDVMQKQGIPIRAQVSDFGPALFSRLLNLTPAQSGVMQILFKAADDNGWQLDDLKDLKAMNAWALENKAALAGEYGNISTATSGAISRALLELEAAGADKFFGLPDLEIQDWLSQTEERGTINLLEAAQLMQQPLLYSAFMLWMLSELSEILPEAGDLDKPRLVFFFDEAHMIFEGASKSLVSSIAQTVRLIRSKGVGIYFITQNPSDIPAEVLDQLSNRILHSLRAYTPAQQKGMKAAAAGFRPNPAFDTLETLSTLATGQALVSFLNEEGIPQMVQKTTILPCASSFDALSPRQVAAISAIDPLADKYGEEVDAYSAWEVLQEMAEQTRAQEEAQAQKAAAAKAARQEKKSAASRQSSTRKTSSPVATAAKRAARTTARGIGRDVGKQIVRNTMQTQSKGVQKAAESFAGSLVSNLIGGLFR